MTQPLILATPEQLVGYLRQVVKEELLATAGNGPKEVLNLDEVAL